jgi:hypothetical protein
VSLLDSLNDYITIIYILEALIIRDGVEERIKAQAFRRGLVRNASS